MVDGAVVGGVSANETAVEGAGENRDQLEKSEGETVGAVVGMEETEVEREVEIEESGAKINAGEESKRKPPLSWSAQVRNRSPTPSPFGSWGRGWDCW